MIHTLGLGGLGLRRVTGGGIVAAALKMNGSDGSTTFTDETGKTWTAFGNAQIDTAQSKFGGASGLFDGTGDYITTPNHPDFEFGSGAFTLEAWVRPASFAAAGNIFRKATTGQFAGCGIFVNATTGTIQGFASFNGTTFGLFFTSSNTLTLNTWSHIALVRSGDTFQLFIDGTSGGTSTVSGTIHASSTGQVIGANASGAGSFNGHIDDARITKGIAKYTANFTPPTVEQSYP